MVELAMETGQMIDGAYKAQTQQGFFQALFHGEMNAIPSGLDERIYKRQVTVEDLGYEEVKNRMLNLPARVPMYVVAGLEDDLQVYEIIKEKRRPQFRLFINCYDQSGKSHLYKGTHGTSGYFQSEDVITNLKAVYFPVEYEKINQRKSTP